MVRLLGYNRAVKATGKTRQVLQEAARKAWCVRSGQGKMQETESCGFSNKSGSLPKDIQPLDTLLLLHLVILLIFKGLAY